MSLPIGNTVGQPAGLYAQGSVPIQFFRRVNTGQPYPAAAEETGGMYTIPVQAGESQSVLESVTEAHGATARVIDRFFSASKQAATFAESLMREGAVISVEPTEDHKGEVAWKVNTGWGVGTRNQSAGAIPGTRIVAQGEEAMTYALLAVLAWAILRR